MLVSLSHHTERSFAVFPAQTDAVLDAELEVEDALIEDSDDSETIDEPALLVEAIEVEIEEDKDALETVAGDLVVPLVDEEKTDSVLVPVVLAVVLDAEALAESLLVEVLDLMVDRVVLAWLVRVLTFLVDEVVLALLVEVLSFLVDEVTMALVVEVLSFLLVVVDFLVLVAGR